MPTYDYQCRSCGVITEVVHSMLEDGPTTCERCGGELRRVIHPTGIIFKGGGFYKTDSRSAWGSSASGARAGSAAASDGGAPASGSTQAGASEKAAPPKPGSDAAKGPAGND